MDYLVRREYRHLGIALAVSLALHALVLCIKLAAPETEVQPAQNQRDSRLDVTLSKPEKMAIPAPAPQRLTPSPLEPSPRVLTRRPSVQVEPAPAWTQAERDEMNQFLNELTEQARPLTGKVLAQRAIETAGRLAAPEQADNELNEMRQKFATAKVDPFSIELYFDALFRKMNRSATMVSKEGISNGNKVAAVRVVVNQDGTLKNFRILWSADQQSQIAFIKAVVENAAPFPVFPQDIRDATDSVVLQICIMPNSFGGSSGATFSRLSPGQTCRES